MEFRVHCSFNLYTVKPQYLSLKGPKKKFGISKLKVTEVI